MGDTSLARQRRREVRRLVAEGRTPQEIADQLGISYSWAAALASRARVRLQRERTDG